jgi:hypothetical protein
VAWERVAWERVAWERVAWERVGAKGCPRRTDDGLDDGLDDRNLPCSPL